MSISDTVYLFGFAFAAAQGGAIFFTAWLVRRYLKLSSVWWKPLLMLLSYFAWIIATGIGYGLLGGGWAMMEGGLFMLGLFSSAAVSSLVYVLAWLVLPIAMKGKTHG